MRRLWAGIDLGTQSVRAVLADDAGTAHGRGAVRLASARPAPGRHEQDPEHWWRATVGALRQAVAQAGPAEIAAIACCATSGTVLLVEERPGEPARPLTPGVMYDDVRAEAEAARLSAAPAPAWADAGLHPQRTWGLAKALWLLARVPAGPRARIAHQADLITSRLIGRPAATDTGHALKSGADPAAGVWPEADLARLGLPPKLLPGLVRPGDRLGEVCAAAAGETGLRAGTPVVAGTTDGCAAQIAAGVLEPGRWNVVVGTTTVLKGVSDAPPRDPAGALYSHRAPDGRWWPGGASNTGAGLLAAEFPVPVPGAAETAREPAGCVTYPLLSTGERFPFERPGATRFTLGSPRDDAERYAALMQGTVYAERLCLDRIRHLGLPVRGPVTLSGGATRDPHWVRLHADVLGRDVAVREGADGAFGMAVLAASTVDGLAAASARMRRPAALVHPRPGAADRFAEPYARLVRALAERDWIDPAFATTALNGAAR